MIKALLTKITTEGFSDELQQQVIALQDAELAYRFAHDLPQANLDLLETVILNTSVPRIAYEFALIKAERGASIEQLQELVLQSEDGGLMVLFAADVEGADMDKFENAVSELPDAKYLQLFEAEMRQKGFY